MAVSEDVSMPNVTVEEVICVKGGRLDKKTVNVPFEVETVGSADVRVFRVRKRDTWLLTPFVSVREASTTQKELVSEALMEIQQKLMILKM